MPRHGAVVPGGLRSTNRTGGGSSASGSGGPGTLPRRDDGTQDPPPMNGPGASSGGKPAWAQEQFAQWQLLHQQYQRLQYQQQLVAVSTTDPWRRIHWGPVEYGHGNGSDWCVIAQSNTTSGFESMNHRQDWYSTPGPMMKSHLRRFGSVAFGHAIARWPCFGLRQKPETGLVSSTF